MLNVQFTVATIILVLLYKDVLHALLTIAGECWVRQQEFGSDERDGILETAPGVASENV